MTIERASELVLALPEDSEERIDLFLYFCDVFYAERPDKSWLFAKMCNFGGVTLL